MLGTCVVNALVIYNSHGLGRTKPLGMLALREKLIEGFLNEGANVNEIGSQASEHIPTGKTKKDTNQRKRAKSSHRIAKYEGSARSSRKRYAECYRTIQKEKRSKEARVKAKKVLTTVKGNPPYVSLVSKKFTSNFFEIFSFCIFFLICKSKTKSSLMKCNY